MLSPVIPSPECQLRENPPPPLGFVISMESADPILDPANLDDWHAAGVRVIGPAHYGPGRYSGGTGTNLGLTGLGRQLLDAMATAQYGAGPEPPVRHRFLGSHGPV